GGRLVAAEVFDNLHISLACLTSTRLRSPGPTGFRPDKSKSGMQSTIHNQVIVIENHRAKVKSGQAELGCMLAAQPTRLFSENLPQEHRVFDPSPGRFINQETRLTILSALVRGQCR